MCRTCPVKTSHTPVLCAVVQVSPSYSAVLPVSCLITETVASVDSSMSLCYCVRPTPTRVSEYFVLLCQADTDTCEWLTSEAKCVRRGRFSAAVTSLAACPLPCLQLAIFTHTWLGYVIWKWMIVYLDLKLLWCIFEHFSNALLHRKCVWFLVKCEKCIKFWWYYFICCIVSAHVDLKVRCMYRLCSCTCWCDK